MCGVSVALAKGYALMYIHCQCALDDVHESPSVTHTHTHTHTQSNTGNTGYVLR